MVSVLDGVHGRSRKTNFQSLSFHDITMIKEMKFSKQENVFFSCLYLVFFKKNSLFIILALCLAYVVILRIDIKRYKEDIGSTTNKIFLRKNSNYLIDTPGCRILNFDPSPPDAQRFFKRTNNLTCEQPGKPDLTSSKGNTLYFFPENIKQYKRTFQASELKHIQIMSSLLLNGTLDALQQFLNNISVNCCYSFIIRKTQNRSSYDNNCDKDWMYGKDCVSITAYQINIKEADAIVVNCTAKNVLFYTNVHHLVQKKTDRVSVTNEASSNDESSHLNVIFFGSDSVSRLNFLRSNPKTYKYLIEELKAFDFKGYNKVGDNTFPNLVPILTGLDKYELLSHVCYTNNTGAKGKAKAMDDCPFIWKEFKKHGYITTYFEDAAKLSLFNYYQRSGFVIQPTDHYGRPSVLVSDQLIGRRSCELCQRNKLGLEVLQEYSLDIMKTYHNESTFSYFWSSALTHDYLNNAVFADIPHLRYLKSLKENGVLNRTVLFFLSDHGMRFGPFRETILGKVEENMPYLFIVVPDWFRERYLRATENLERNSNLLVTPFDLHQTLLDIILLQYKNLTYLETSTGIRRSISLFQKIPPERTCKDIRFSLKFCLCQEYVPLANSSEVVANVTTYIKEYLNKMLKPFPNCYQIKEVQPETIYEGIVDKRFYKDVQEKVLSVQARYYPGDALIDATLFWKTANKKQPFYISGEISRINKYGNQSHCITNTDMKKFCICKDTEKPKSDAVK